MDFEVRMPMKEPNDFDNVLLSDGGGSDGDKNADVDSDSDSDSNFDADAVADAFATRSFPSLWVQTFGQWLVHYSFSIVFLPSAVGSLLSLCVRLPFQSDLPFSWTFQVGFGVFCSVDVSNVFVRTGWLVSSCLVFSCTLQLKVISAPNKPPLSSISIRYSLLKRYPNFRNFLS